MKRVLIPLFAAILSLCIFSCANHGKSKDPASLFDADKFQQAYLKAPNNSDSDQFGWSVSISGDTIAVGADCESSDTTTIINSADLSATNDSKARSGAVYVYTRNGNEWMHQAYLKAPNSSEYGYFGYTVAISGDTIAVGTDAEDSSTTQIINGSDLSGTNDSGVNNGAVYVFHRIGTEWSLQAYLKAPNIQNMSGFGYSLAISGDTIVVGAPTEKSTTTAVINGDDLSGTNNSGGNNGAVYVFHRTGSTWSHQAYLKAPNNSDGDQFGYSVAISGDTIAVGSYNECSTTTEIIDGSDLSETNNAGRYNGAVYVFTRTGAVWSHQAYLKAPNNSEYDYFGKSVSISGDTIAVGAYGEDSTTTDSINGADLTSTNDSGLTNGAVYVFQRSGATWTHEAYLKAPNNSNLDCFGISVSISGDIIAVGAFYEGSTTKGIIVGSDLSATNDGGSRNGAVYVFARRNGEWSHLAYLKAPNTSNEDYFGETVSASGTTVVTGAFFEDSNTTAIIDGPDLSAANDSGYNNGAAYVFTYR